MVVARRLAPAIGVDGDGDYRRRRNDPRTLTASRRIANGENVLLLGPPAPARRAW
jgi:hypothetical protein